MSFTAQPEMLAAAAGELRSLGATLKASNAAAAVPTTGVVPPAADEVSLLLATQFRTHAATYQTASAKAAVIQQFVTTLATSASSYADTEAANAVVTG
ncbi:PE family protein [Mycobacterium tuberculosis]|uniref:PE family protein n=1 Tax=Mycobacterium tuberculosis TaxID=1773 RepID=UPI00045BA30E|nr:PE family protein [Mycobacterium tuberculosis]KCA91285.1 PE family protein PE31 [Mycobacterium tuberculosis TKK-01-0086]